jgi:hypothetical protein
MAAGGDAHCLAGSALMVLVLATTEPHSEVELPVGMEPMLRLMVRGLLNGRGRAGQAAAGGDLRAQASSRMRRIRSSRAAITCSANIGDS